MVATIYHELNPHKKAQTVMEWLNTLFFFDPY
jgi:hypothetical protein